LAKKKAVQVCESDICNDCWEKMEPQEKAAAEEKVYIQVLTEAYEKLGSISYTSADGFEHFLMEYVEAFKEEEEGCDCCR
jgi:hypothetical protein